MMNGDINYRNKRESTIAYVETFFGQRQHPMMLPGILGFAEEDSLVIGLSDADLTRYGIHPSELGGIMAGGFDLNMRTHAIFISSQSPFTTMVRKGAITIAHWINPWHELIVGANGLEGAKPGLQYALNYSFGEMEFNWDDNTIQIRVRGLDMATPLMSLKWKMYCTHSFTITVGAAVFCCQRSRSSMTKKKKA